MPHPTCDVAVVIGRFQPFHNGHADLLARALDTAPRVLVLLGTAFRARSPKDPFSWRERADMLHASLGAQERARVTCAPVRDHYDDARWTAAVRRIVHAHAGGGARVTLVGHHKDASSYYLRRFPDWTLLDCERLRAIDATALRQVLFASEAPALAALRGALPQAVGDYLDAWRRTPAHAALVEEQRALDRYREAWSAAPYPPVFVTVDALVQAAGHVLLVRRGRNPGKGLWALPGGFLDEHERLLDAAVRELIEETQLAVAAPRLAACCTDAAVFDHPGRSLRGRTVTHVHRFQLGADTLPDIAAADDAAHAAWVPVDTLPAMEETFHEDHFHILDTMLGLLPG